MADLVNHPSHYNQNGVETIDIIEAALTPEEFRGFLKGNVMKYLDRHEYKNGEQDLKKAKWYTNKLLDELIKDELRGVYHRIDKKLQSVLYHVYRIGEGSHGQSAIKYWEEYRNDVMNNFQREKCQKIDEYMDRYLNQGKLEDIKKAQEYAKELFNINGGDLEEYEPWFIELHESNFKTAVRLWEEYRNELSKDL